jgi:succinate-semialdehyde dehydrogenase/glutarate-semialdehyde dehydrogenase
MAIGGLFIDGRWNTGSHTITITDNFTGREVADAEQASASQVEQALDALAAGQAKAPIPAYERYEILSRASAGLIARRAELIDLAIGETGFTHSDLDDEINRAVQTLAASAEESKRIVGEMVPLEGAPGVLNRIGYTIRVPVGIVCSITPFNSPINTLCHKLGPAIAAGNSVVVKPSSFTPLSASAVVEVLLEAGLPPDRIALVNGSSKEIGPALLEDERVGFYAFTGSTETGRVVREKAGLRRTALELGGLSSTIVCEDADLGLAAERCVTGAFRKAGQVCTSVQRLYVHTGIYDQFVDELIASARPRVTGDPRDPATFVGPMISNEEAARVAAWIEDAIEGGARRVIGDEPEGILLHPTILEDVDMSMNVMCREVFGPVMSLRRYSDLESTIHEINSTPYGLAAGAFTQDLTKAHSLARSLRMGTVHINQTSSSRIDIMPYGGVKDSGYGKEGPRYSIREMTEERLVTMSF